MGWTVGGENIFDVTDKIDTDNFGSTFSASKYAKKVMEAGGTVIAWLYNSNPPSGGYQRETKKGMYIWPVSLVIFKTNNTLGGL